MELREEVAMRLTVFGMPFGIELPDQSISPGPASLDAADAILSLPRIREALEAQTQKRAATPKDDGLVNKEG